MTYRSEVIRTCGETEATTRQRLSTAIEAAKGVRLDDRSAAAVAAAEAWLRGECRGDIPRSAALGADAAERAAWRSGDQRAALAARAASAIAHAAEAADLAAVMAVVEETFGNGAYPEACRRIEAEVLTDSALRDVAALLAVSP